MADLKYPRRGHIMGATPFEPMKILIGDKPMVGMVVGREFMVVDNDGKMDTYNPVHGDVTFLGYLTREESFTIIGSEDPHWEMPAEVDLPMPDLKRGCSVRDVPDFMPYVFQSADGTRYNGVNIPRRPGVAGKERLGILRFRSDNSADAYSDIDTTRGTFVEFLEDQSLDPWRNHKIIRREGGQDPSLWPS